MGEWGRVSTAEKRGEGRKAGKLCVRVGSLRIKGRSGRSGGPEILPSVWEGSTRQLSGAGSPPWSLQSWYILGAQRLPGRWRGENRIRSVGTTSGSHATGPWIPGLKGQGGGYE